MLTAFWSGPDVAAGFGKHWVDTQGQEWQLAAQNDRHYPYFRKVSRQGDNITIEPRLYTLPEGPRVAALLAGLPAPSLVSDGQPAPNPAHYGRVA